MANANAVDASSEVVYEFVISQPLDAITPITIRPPFFVIQLTATEP
jgi:hypothetical protein